MTEPTTEAGRRLAADPDLCWPEPGPDLREAIAAIEAEARAIPPNPDGTMEDALRRSSDQLKDALIENQRLREARAAVLREVRADIVAMQIPYQAVAARTYRSDIVAAIDRRLEADDA